MFVIDHGYMGYNVIVKLQLMCSLMPSVGNYIAKHISPIMEGDYC